MRFDLNRGRNEMQKDNRIFWGFVYLLTAALAVAVIYLYVIPEREISIAENIEAETAPEWIEMPVYTVNGVRTEIGTPCLGALLDSGLSLKFEADGNLYDLEPEAQDASPRTRYAVALYYGNLPVADLMYANSSDRPRPVRDCEVDALDFRTDRQGWDSVETLVSGIPVKDLRMEEIPEKFPAFEKSFSETPEYVCAALTETQSMVAYFRGTKGGDLAEFGFRNYLPGSAGTER